MAQYLKDEIQESIAAAALKVFAEEGYVDATMAGIAKAARVSTGNIYRYYKSKDALFHAVVTEDFVQTFLRLLRRRVKALDGVEDIRRLEPAATYFLASEELLQFTVENRLRVIILLGRAQGTRYERFAEDVAQELIKLAIAHFRAVRPGTRVTETMKFNMEQIYRAFVGAMAGILTRFEDEARIREAVEGYSKYHLAGLNSLFG